MGSGSPTSDERYKVAYEAATSLMASQHSVVDNLRQRATTLISASTVATTFAVSVGLLGTGSKPLPNWTVFVLLGLVLFVGGCALYILWPVKWSLGISADALIDDYIESSPPSSLDDMYRDMAIYLQQHLDTNQAELDGLLNAFRIGVVGLTAEAVVLLIGFLAR